MNWILFPLYGLKISEPTAWLDEPLFGDATLVSRAALQAYLGPETNALLSHGKLSEALGVEGIASLRLPPSQLVEIEPLSYIAVRDHGDNSRNVRRATEIRALLSATLVLRAGRLQMVAASPAEIAWYIAPGKIVIAPSQPVKTDIAPQFNEHALLTPIEISQDSLRRSLKDGTAIPNANSWDWDIHERHPVCQLFFGKISKFQRRLLDCAVQIQEAGCATSYATQLQMAVASMEVLLKPKSFSDLERILRAFFHGSDQEKRIESLLKTRHRITHEGAGRGDDAGQVKDGARDALNFAWLMLDIVTAFDRGVNALSFDDYILLLIQAIDLDEKSASLKREDPRAHERMLHKDVTSFVQHLTARIKFNTGAA